MYLIEGHWETLENLYDVSRVIREYYNSDLADILDELIEGTVTSEEDIKRLDELESIIYEIRMLIG